MNHSQQLKQSLGKQTELICTPNKLFRSRVNVLINVVTIDIKYHSYFMTQLYLYSNFVIYPLCKRNMCNLKIYFAC